jgi:hypothetical protein
MQALPDDDAYGDNEDRPVRTNSHGNEEAQAVPKLESLQ